MAIFPKYPRIKMFHIICGTVVRLFPGWHTSARAQICSLIIPDSIFCVLLMMFECLRRTPLSLSRWLFARRLRSHPPTPRPYRDVHLCALVDSQVLWCAAYPTAPAPPPGAVGRAAGRRGRDGSGYEGSADQWGARLQAHRARLRNGIGLLISLRHRFPHRVF